MKLSLSTKWFFWMSGVIGFFCLAQILGMVWLEVVETLNSDEPLYEELSEIFVLISVSACVFILMLGGLRFVSKRMIRPIRAIAESASRISEGDRMERIDEGAGSDEVGMLASALNQAFDRYHDVVRRLDTFAGNAAHQLRTPLASLTTVGEVCLQKERQAMEYRECIGCMLEITGELTDVVEKLLMIARLNPARLRQGFGPVDLSEVVAHVVDVCSVALQEKNIRFSRHGASRLNATGDAGLIRQAIGNVVDNAVEYTPKGGRISVTLQERDGRAVLEIRDTGPGIPENLRGVLTQKAKHPTRGDYAPGGRMGLAIVSEIMRVHEGTLEIQANEGGGTCVRLTWPQDTANSASPPATRHLEHVATR